MLLPGLLPKYDTGDAPSLLCYMTRQQSGRVYSPALCVVIRALCCDGLLQRMAQLQALVVRAGKVKARRSAM